MFEVKEKNVYIRKIWLQFNLNKLLEPKEDNYYFDLTRTLAQTIKPCK